MTLISCWEDKQESEGIVRGSEALSFIRWGCVLTGRLLRFSSSLLSMSYLRSPSVIYQIMDPSSTPIFTGYLLLPSIFHAPAKANLPFETLALVMCQAIC